MGLLPAFVGPAALGLKMGVILPGCNLKKLILDKLKECDEAQLLSSGDILCITESIVAKGENNYIPLKEITQQVKEKLKLKDDDTLGIVFPITSRNRFSMILQALARTVPKGQLIVQLSFPTDEVGNQIIDQKTLLTLGKDTSMLLDDQELKGYPFYHPMTGVNYVDYYLNLIENEGPKAHIILANDPKEIQKYNPKGIIAASIHNREDLKALLKTHHDNCITLQEICCTGPISSPFGLLGSNLSSHEKLKLAPRDGDTFVKELREEIYKATNKRCSIIIYGDGAYKDPITGIYELADPQTFFGATEDLQGLYRQGVKYKYLVDEMLAQGKNIQQIEEVLKIGKKVEKKDDFLAEGTTPRRLIDILASLADLLSGSANTGTPLVLIKNFH